MALGQGAAGIATLLIATLAARQHVSVPLLCGLVCVTSACDAVAWTAFLAGMQGMVEPRQLGRANGLAQLGDAVSAVLAPIAATALLTRAPLSDVLVCDALTSFVASLAACAAAPKIEGAGWAARPSFVAELREVLDFLRPRTGLCALATISCRGTSPRRPSRRWRCRSSLGAPAATPRLRCNRSRDSESSPAAYGRASRVPGYLI